MGGAGEGVEHFVEAFVDVVVAGFEESVGVEGEEAAFGELGFEGFEGEAAQAQWGAGGDVEEADVAVGGDDGGWGWPARAMVQWRVVGS
ncbi:hypothetical protein SAV14893_095060 [Streptomyces avermitilis]|uniref:Uncharacterized protein n=1 Tax=Streptomyces avermitilis TaxID=33903 RepID=A0A4D4MDW3_STRAX|nr:hypothetical protein SAV14893_095060 [Streptomyces avermitilis]